ncbi:MAG: metallophosphoesterase [Pseudomonadota bacterium]
MIPAAQQRAVAASEGWGIEATSITLAHLSDPHLGPMEGASRDARLTLKQRLAFRRWRTHRRHVFRAETAMRLAADVRAAGPDHIAVTGDLANAGLPAEFDAAACWLEALAPGPSCAGWDRERLSLVPGNHDALAPGSWEAGAARLGLSQPQHPWQRRIGPVALIGLSTALPTVPLLATGRIGDEQVRAAEALLAEAAAARLCRVVLLHHPPGRTTGPRRALTDRRAFVAMLERVGAELVLYGHNHRAEDVRLGAAGILALGAPSAAGTPGGGAEAAGWYAIAISGAPDGWRARVTLRRIDADGRFHDERTTDHIL